MKKILLTAMLLAVAAGGSAQVAIGQWRDCLDYATVYHVALAGDRVYAGARGGVFCYDTVDQMLTRMSKGAGLSDVGVAAMAYSGADGCLAVAYTNSNIDLVVDGRTYNLSDIKRSEIPGDKSIYHIRFHAGNAYLATGFGVVVVDIGRREIKETWYLGTGGTYAPVYDLAFLADSLYAATGEGLKRLSASERFPSVSDRWETDRRLDSVTLTTLEPFAGRLLLSGYADDPRLLTLYELDAAGFRVWNRGEINSMRVGGGKVTLTRDHCIVQYNERLERYDSLCTYAWGTLSAFDAVTDEDGTLWVGHEWDGLMHITPGGYEVYRPSGPFSHDNAYRLVPFNYRMMLCPGGHTSTYANTYLEPNLFTSQGSQWEGLDLSNGMLDGCADVVDAAVNPRDTTEVVIALWGSGVASVRNRQVERLYDETNTSGALVPYSSGTYSTLNTGAVAFDRQGDLWVLNSQSSHALAVRRADGSWEGFSTEAMVAAPEVDKLVVDSITGYKWFLGRSNIIYVHDGKNRMARVNPNNGSKLNTDAVTALVQDHSGVLWLGTNKGLKVIYDGSKAFAGGGNGEISPVNCNNITITNGDFYEYLMAYESITAIAVDGANRKWVGTANGGLYLLSSNGMDQLEHFTTSNSPLFSDRIVALGINERTGEVFVGTDRGLQVYRGTATYAVSNPLSEVYAFPNPVRPGYDGPIAVKGLSRNALVHITDAAGHTVYATTAHGGQAIWNGRTQSGEQVASGVYYVFASDDKGDNRSVAKILIIR